MDVVVIIGADGIGEAIARRLGLGHKLLLADCNAAVLQAAAQRLADAGFVTGTDLLIDGGVIAAMFAGKIRQPGCTSFSRS